MLAVARPEWIESLFDALNSAMRASGIVQVAAVASLAEFIIVCKVAVAAHHSPCAGQRRPVAGCV
jgi:hypothetical protein